MSTIEVGDNFRDEVADLLRAGGYRPESEILVGHKRVDITFYELSFGRRRRYAVEAKNWAKALSKTFLESIYGGYAALLNREVDEILVVSPHDLKSPAAKAFVRDTPHISHLSFNEFQESVLGFRGYLQTFIAKHKRDGLEDYYVSPLTNTDEDLVPAVLKWLEDEGTNPLAIIASYGMGKTSFAEHLTYVLASQFLNGVSCRVPVLVRLGMISREQSIEGLIGTVLAGGSPSVAGYNFPVFARLNAIGRFVVLLDGFDEMKHMMTHAEFIANFDELNKLVDGSAKVILLGRPTAFLSEDERISVLRGTRPIGRTRVRAAGSPIYDEINLRPFTPAQLSTFIQAYLKRWQKNGGEETAHNLFERRRAEIEEPGNQELLSRPIHARMMADLATDPSFDMKDLSRFALYDHFVDFLISRELAKAGRGGLFKANDRRSFAADLAWFLWTQHSSTGLGCRIDELPDELFNPYIPAAEERRAAQRDLLSGSFLDEKHGGVFFFSHKSFQEFLVAEYIWTNVTDYTGGDTEQIVEFVERLTKEVFTFLVEQDDELFFRSLMTAISECREGFSMSAVNILCSSARLYQTSLRRSASNFSLWDAVMLLAYPIITEESGLPDRLARNAKTVVERAARKPMVLLAGVNAVITIGVSRSVNLEILLAPIVILLYARAEADFIELSVSQKARSRSDMLRDVILQVVTAKREKDGDIIMSLDLRELVTEINQVIRVPTTIFVDDESMPAPISASFEAFFKDTNAARSRVVREFYERDAIIEGRMKERSTE